MEIFWIILWILVGAGWSALSFHWLRKSVEEIQPQPESQKHTLKGLFLRRFVMFLLVALLLYLALQTEPIGAIAMVIVITIATWVQVIIYNRRLNETTGRKEH